MLGTLPISCTETGRTGWFTASRVSTRWRGSPGDLTLAGISLVWLFVRMKKRHPTVLSAICPACNEQSSHSVSFEDKLIRHIRCDSCGVLHACASKGSFYAGIHPLDFAELTKLATVEAGAIPAYHSGTTFHPADLLEHPTLGVGYVAAVLSPPNKMEVIFADKTRVLVCAPDSGILEEPVVATKTPTRKSRSSN
jgi:Zn ribbon nucleic-acid-binding protein